MEKNKSKFVVRNQITIGDFQVFGCLDIYFALNDDNVLSKKLLILNVIWMSLDNYLKLKDYIEEAQKELAINSPSMLSIYVCF